MHFIKNLSKQIFSKEETLPRSTCIHCSRSLYFEDHAPLKLPCFTTRRRDRSGPWYASQLEEVLMDPSGILPLSSPIGTVHPTCGGEKPGTKRELLRGTIRGHRWIPYCGDPGIEPDADWWARRVGAENVRWPRKSDWKMSPRYFCLVEYTLSQNLKLTKKTNPNPNPKLIFLELVFW